MNRDDLIELLTSTLDGYLAEVEPGEEDTDDMAHALLRAMERAGALK